MKSSNKTKKKDEIILLEPKEQKNLKIFSKIVYVISKICKICAAICIPIILLVIAVIPYFIKRIDIKDDKITFNGIEKITIIENNEKIEFKISDMLISETTKPEEIQKVKDFFKENSKTKIIAYGEAAMIFLTISLVIIILLLNHMEKIFNNINTEETPFTLENTERIRKIAWLMVYSIVISSLSKLILILIINNGNILTVNFFNVIEILVVFSLYYIFKYASRLQSNSDSKIYDEISE